MQKVTVNVPRHIADIEKKRRRRQIHNGVVFDAFKRNGMGDAAGPSWSVCSP
jgi:hypothetical protein